MRQLVFELSPPELEESGLDSALRRAADHLFGTTDVTVDVSCVLPAEPPAEAQGTVYRIAVEALTNVRKHAHAARVDVRIGLDDATSSSRSPTTAAACRRRRTGHLGLRAMHDRAAAVGGSCPSARCAWHPAWRRGCR